MKFTILVSLLFLIILVTLVFYPKNKHCTVIDEIPEQVGNTIELKCNDGSVVWLTRN